MMKRILIASLAIVVGMTPLGRADDAGIVAEAMKDRDGFLIHEVRSEYQSGPTQIRVLRPDVIEPDRKYAVVYVLPVEAGRESRYGDGLTEIKRHDLHNKHRVFFVAPTFSQLPWYADHPTDSGIRQESYLVKVVVPYVDKTYPVRAEASGRFLLGFSKSGWGAWSLLLRHPDLFQKAAAWDAPLVMDRPGKYGSGEIFGTAENFEKYRVSKLLENRALLLLQEKRLVLLGYGNFRREHEEVHALMDKLKIAHEYRDGPERKHDWHSGWVEEAIALLIGQSR